MTSDENSGAFDGNASLSKAEATVQPSGPTPIEGGAPGIAPVAEFVPKDVHTSHPTPPPDEPLATSEANVDVEMTPAADESLPAADPQPAPELSAADAAVTSTESSLVRQREDDADEDDEPAAKRSRVDATIADAPLVDAQTSNQTDAPEQSSSEPAIKPEEPAVPAAAETSAVDASLDQQIAAAATPVKAETDAAEGKPEVNADAESAPQPGETAAVPAGDVKQSTESQAASATTQPPVRDPKRTYTTAPMTTAQHRFLQEKTKNLKKTKNSIAFLNPVDPVALNIPHYRDIVKSPMDLSTMESKLKSHTYKSVQEYADDFFLIVDNSAAFNGEAHPVTQAGRAMEAYFYRMLETVPSATQATPAKPAAKKASPKPPAQVQRRESRSAVQATTPAAAASASGTNAAGEAFALQPDGTPQIRRDSTINRPARAIKPPPARELTYSKPKRKEHQLELKFCDHVLQELRSPRYGRVNQVFLAPVDPVALNIPHYRQIVKHPMDLSTMAQKLKQGQYGKATEFEKDFKLMIQNCLAFNPVGNPVRDLGIEFQRNFDALWKSKEKWERTLKANSERATSASADEDSQEEDEEEEEESSANDPQQTILALQKQLAEMQNALAGLNKPIKTKSKSKAGAKSASTKKAGHAAALPKQKGAVKAKPKGKPKNVTYEEKQEISEAVGKMNGPQVEELTRIITTNCKKYADQEEMELEIDDLPNDVQVLLLKYVRSIFGGPARGARAISPDDIAAVDDDDFEPERTNRKSGGGASKRKKHKPMGKKEQQDAIDTLQRKLSQFNGPAPSASQSPSNSPAQEETSGDEDSEESEEE